MERCDECNRKFELEEQIIRLVRTKDGLTAGYTIAGPRETLDGELVGTYHRPCYLIELGRKPELPPLI